MSATATEALPNAASTTTVTHKELPDKLPLQERALQAEEMRLVKGDDGFTRLTFSCASENPVPRWYGDEVLSHEANAVRMDRIKRGACPLLFNHDMDDPVGMVTDARIERKRLVVDVKLFKTARAAEIESWIDGGLRNVSLLYRIYITEEDVKKQRYTHTDWEPYEVSIVTIPADSTVGIGRAQETGELFELRTVRLTPVPSTTAPSARSNAMTDQVTAPAGQSAEQQTQAQIAARATEAQQQQQAPQGSTAMELERERRTGIENLCKGNNIADNIRNYWITSGMSMTKVSEELLGILKSRGETNPKSDAMIGLSPKEAKRFSVRQAILATASQNWTQAGFEAECSSEIAKRLGKTPEPNRFYIPYEVQQRGIQNAVEALAFAMMKRDLTVATPGAGGYLVATENIGFIELLRNTSVLYNMGVTRLTGLQGNVTIPKQSAAATAYWLATESTQITESQPTFVQVAMAPKNIGGYTEISRQLLIQSDPSAEGLVMADLAAVVALAIDLAGLNGSGASGQPTGILQTSGIGSVTGTSMDFADIIEFLTDVFAGNALAASSGFVTTGAVAGLLMQRVKFSSTASPIWEGGLPEGRIQGHRAMASNQVPTATMAFGDFAKTVIGEWGVLEIEVNPFANFQAGIIGIRAMASVDVCVRYPTAYSAASSIT